MRSLASAVELAGGKASPELLLLLAEAQLGAGLTGSAEATCGRLLEGSPDPNARADALVLLARVAYSTCSCSESGRRYRGAVDAAEGTDRLVGTLAEAVMCCSKDEGPPGFGR